MLWSLLLPFRPLSVGRGRWRGFGRAAVLVGLMAPFGDAHRLILGESLGLGASPPSMTVANGWIGYAIPSNSGRYRNASSRDCNKVPSTK